MGQDASGVRITQASIAAPTNARASGGKGRTMRLPLGGNVGGGIGEEGVAGGEGGCAL